MTKMESIIIETNFRQKPTLQSNFHIHDVYVFRGEVDFFGVIYRKNIWEIVISLRDVSFRSFTDALVVCKESLMVFFLVDSRGGLWSGGRVEVE